MKDIIVCFHMLVTSVACVAQCGSFSFTTQAEIDQFGIDHPDCTDIGDLFIEGEDIFDLTPLSNITSGNEMRIRNCPNLVGGIEFNNLDHCGSLTINSNDNVQHISIPELKTANDGLAFHNNIALQSYEAPKLEYTNLLSIINNRTIQSHNIDLKALKAVQSLAVEECENIEDLTFLSGLEEVEFRFELFRNDQLRSLAGLENLNYIYTFDIYENISLESLEALENLTSVELQLTISRCDALTSLRGLDNIEWIGKGEYTGFFLLENNNSLLSLDALESFSEVGDLVIRQNIKLKNLDPLSNLTTVGGILLITSNIELTDLSGLDNVDVNELDKLDISNNWELESCGSKFVCEYLESGKEVLIENNKFGCRSVEQVTEDCLTSTHPEIVNDDSITLFPNPTSRYLQINGIAISDITSIAIYDVLGRQVYRSDSTIDFADDIDVSDLGYGSFIMEVQLVSNRVAYERFVKY